VASQKCEIINNDSVKCHRISRYIMGIRSNIPSVTNDDNRMYHVCGTHDKLIGRHNLIALGWSKEQATRWESNPTT
jgi:hypothetical protein